MRQQRDAVLTLTACCLALLQGKKGKKGKKGGKKGKVMQGAALEHCWDWLVDGEWVVLV